MVNNGFVFVCCYFLQNFKFEIAPKAAKSASLIHNLSNTCRCLLYKVKYTELSSHYQTIFPNAQGAELDYACPSPPPLLPILHHPLERNKTTYCQPVAYTVNILQS